MAERKWFTRKFKQRHFAHGVKPRYWSGEKFDASYKAEIARWAKVVQVAGIVPE
ncbi:MAG: hypothetical protein ACO3IW_04665 [Burkholderiales bacterium]